MKASKTRICVSVCARSLEELEGSIRRAAEVGDLIEIRFDCLQRGRLEDALEEIAKLRQSLSQPFIFTLRPRDQGGFREIDVTERLQFWQSFAKLLAPSDFADVEAELMARDVQIDLDMNRVICSHHDFLAVRSDLGEQYEAMSRTNCGVLKLAVQADDATDCIPVFSLLQRAQREGRELIAIAMGPAGMMTRILGPSRGSFLTYGSLDDESATAPGQLTARELRDVYRIDSINGQTDVMGVIGRPVTHSISPHIHNAAFAGANLNAVFIPFDVQDAGAFIHRMVKPNTREIDWKLRGLSVTAPHKSTVIQYLNWIDPAARAIGAVNTIVVEGDELHGYNTDAIGFIQPLKQKLGSLEGLRCAVIGAGGAARAVVWALHNQKASVAVFGRDREKAKSLASEFSVESGGLSQADWRGFDMVLNATPLGTRGEAQAKTPVTAAQLRGVRLAYDLVYNPRETQFIREAIEAGCETISGLEMLIGQAIEQFKLWTGLEPNVDVMRAAAANALL